MKSRPVPFTRRVHHTALAIVPPSDDTECWTQLTELRCRCRDKGFYRWPPHINLVYPFIDSSEFPLFAERLTHSLAKTASFEVSLSRMDTFGGKNSGVCWLDPCTDKANIGAKNVSTYETLSQLHTNVTNVLENESLDCGSVSKQQPARPFRPHLTFNHSPNLAAATAIVKAEQENWTGLSFCVKELYLLERRQPDDQFRVVAIVPLGSENCTSTTIAQPEDSAEKQYQNEESETRSETRDDSEVGDVSLDPPSAIFFSPAVKLPQMPDSEEDWVRDVSRNLSNSRSRGRPKKGPARGAAGGGGGGHHTAKK